MRTGRREAGCYPDQHREPLAVMDDGVVSDIKRGRAARNAKLASIPVGMAGRAALGFGKRLTGKSKDEVSAELMEKAANQLFSVFGELKGGAMKVGQALSVLEAAIPEEFGEPYREALTKLQKDAPPLAADKVHRVLDAQLGTKWREPVRSFDDKPVASASIGQVHKAVWSDGRVVAVKIQYPGADEALRADLKTMQRMVGVLQTARARRRRARRGRRADRAHRDGARLSAGGRQPARIRQGVRRPPAFRGAPRRGQRAQGGGPGMDRGHADGARSSATEPPNSAT